MNPQDSISTSEAACDEQRYGKQLRPRPPHTKMNDPLQGEDGRSHRREYQWPRFEEGCVHEHDVHVPMKADEYQATPEAQHHS